MQVNNNANWILLRGLTRESGHWGDFVPHLSTAYPHTRIYPLDLPGTGVFFQEKSPGTVPAITGYVREYARQNGWLETPVNLLGVSLGGMVALDWLQTYPDEINAAVLINISVGGLNPFYQRLRWQCIPNLLRVILHSKVYDRELAIIKLISNHKENYETLAGHWHHIQTEHPVSAKTALSQLKAAVKYCPHKNKPAMPVLLLNSTVDRLVAPTCTAAIGQHWDLPYLTHPWAGHDLTTDDGDWAITQIQDWYKSLS